MSRLPASLQHIQAQAYPLLHSSLPTQDLSLGKRIDEARQPFFKKTQKFKPTSHVVPDGPACRIYGSVEVKKVTGNLHITTLGHGYWSWEHTDHASELSARAVREDSLLTLTLVCRDELVTRHSRVQLRPLLPRHLAAPRLERRSDNAA